MILLCNLMNLRTKIYLIKYIPNENNPGIFLVHKTRPILIKIGQNVKKSKKVLE